MPYRKFPDVNPALTYVVDGQTLLNLFDAVVQDGKLAASPPLMITDGPHGKTISLALPPGATLLRLTGTSTGAGTYTARVQSVTTTTQSTSTDLNLATWYGDLNTSDDAVFENTLENNFPAGTHLLSTGSNSFAIAFVSGRFASDLSNRPIYHGQVAFMNPRPVSLSQSGGSNGSATSAASYTYNMTDTLTSNSISGGPYAVTWARRSGLVNAATHGLAYVTTSGWTLYQADEQIQQTTC